MGKEVTFVGAIKWTFGTATGRGLLAAAALNLVVAYGRAAYQEHLEDSHEVFLDGKNLHVTALQNFFWDNPKDAVLFLHDQFTKPE